MIRQPLWGLVGDDHMSRPPPFHIHDQVPYPAILDIIVERETDASMGSSIDTVREFEDEREEEKKKMKAKKAA